ncbi:MAG: prepilin-type N-terminal cleavage/methylation domain-containing protein, partial [Candidatus Saccharimonadales bacterium]
MHTGVNSNKHHHRGFTIVELLVVIVVIGVLAAITIVSYTGVTNKAIIASIKSDLANASQQLKFYQVTNGSYPTSLDASYCPIPVDSARCLKPSPGTSYQYTANNTGSQTFSLYAINSDNKYRIT